MADELTISGLVRKRAEIAGRIVQMQNEIEQLANDLRSLDATIRLFDPNLDTEGIKAKLPRPHYAFRGDLTRIALDALRDATEPMWTGDIAKRVIAERGLPMDDKAVWRATTKGVGRALREQRKRGVVRSIAGQRQRVLWEIVV